MCFCDPADRHACIGFDALGWSHALYVWECARTQRHSPGLKLACLPAPGFYKGRIADAIVAALAERGGVMAAEDLASHRSHPTRPVHSTYRGHTIYEIPPPVAVRAWRLILNTLVWARTPRAPRTPPTAATPFRIPPPVAVCNPNPEI